MLVVVVAVVIPLAHLVRVVWVVARRVLVVVSRAIFRQVTQMLQSIQAAVAAVMVVLLLSDVVVTEVLAL
jgi:hypothetical protein